MPVVELDSVIDRLLPVVLADRDLGNGKSFTQVHFDRLWTLSCFHIGECLDRELLEERVAQHLPARVQIIRRSST